MLKRVKWLFSILAVLFILSGYYLLLGAGVNEPFEYLVRRVEIGIILTIVGAVMILVYIFLKNR